MRAAAGRARQRHRQDQRAGDVTCTHSCPRPGSGCRGCRHSWVSIAALVASLSSHPAAANLLMHPSVSQHPFIPSSRQRNSLRMSPPGWLIAPDKLRWLLYRALAPAASLSASSITLSAHPDPQLQIPLPTTGDTWRGLPAQATATGKELSIHSPERGTAAAGRWPQAKDFTGI